MGLKWLHETILGVLLFLVGMALFFRADQIVGDLGDSRFNMYVLEHGYRWLTGLDKSFWSAPFFYPAANVIAYSDNHLGSLLFYSAFRLLGQGRETAFQLWAVTIFTLNYFVTWIVLRKQKFHPVGAIAATYIFTFPLVMAAQNTHIQLAPRFMVPVAFWMALRFVEEGEGKYLRRLLLACAYQIYLGIYIGYFLILSIGSFFVFLLLFRKRWNSVRDFFQSRGPRATFRRGVDYTISYFCFLLVLLPLAMPYYQTQLEMGRRSWDDITPMLPRWQSYVHAPTSFLWGSMLHLGESLPAANEHALFLGVLPCAAILIFAYVCWAERLNAQEVSIGFAMICAFLFLTVVTFYSSGFSLYWYLWKFLPGAGGIRAVTRCMLVGIYPLAFVFGTLLSFLLKNRIRTGRGWSNQFVGLAILALAVADQVGRVGSVSKRECERRIAEMQAAILRIQNHDDRRKVLWVSERNGEPYFIKQLDAMLAGQDLGLSVINGFSGLPPSGYPPEMFILAGDCCAELGFWVRTHPGAFANDSLLEIGPNCEVPRDFLPIPGKGFSRIEFGRFAHVWAVDRLAELQLPENPGQQDERVVSFDLATWKSRSVRVAGPDEPEQTVHLVPGSPQHVEIRIPPGNANAVIKFQTDVKGKKPPGEDRTLFFDVENLAEKAIRPGESDR